MVNAVSADLLAATNGASSGDKSPKANSVEQMQNQFLTLLITQLQNQDPTNPMENAEMTSQLAQMSTVSGIEKMNDNMASMMSLYQSTQIVNASSLIGRGVFTEGSKLSLDTYKLEDDKTAKQGILGVNLPNGVDSLSVSIINASGVEVYKMNLGEQKAGVVPLAWNGETAAGTTAPDGEYTFRVTAKRNGEKVDAKALMYGKVNSVTSGADGVLLNVGQSDKIKVSDIVQVI